MFFISCNIFDVSGESYYVGTTGEDSNSCSQSDPCKTLDAQPLYVDSTTEYTVYIIDSTTLSKKYGLAAILSTQHTFTNNPENIATQSVIQINIGGQFRILDKTRFERINFTMQDEVSNAEGGVIFANLDEQFMTLEIISCNFIGCNATSNGGALYLQISSQTESTLRNLSFNKCESQSFGGAIYTTLESGGKLIIAESCIFIDCLTRSNSSINEGGGGIFASISGENSQLTIEDSITFENCSGRYGGGIYLNISSLSKFSMTGSQLFKDCSSISRGGGCYINTLQSNYNIQLLGRMKFEGCTSNSYTGGGFITSQYAGQITINEMSFSNCSSYSQGGGLHCNIRAGTQMTITGKILFDKCHKSGTGGGQYLSISGAETKISFSDGIEYNQCNASSGGGLYAAILNNAIVQINNVSFRKCSSSGDGGGLCATIQSGGQLILNKSCEFYQCEANENGGGIYIYIYIKEQCSFIIRDALIHDCKALNNTDQYFLYSYSGFGGGLFIESTGDYVPSTNLIDLHGMKIYNNTADKYGQSLYVAMPQVAEWCQYGILGEYVKGNYSDTYSDQKDLVGIPMDFSAFIFATSEEIIELQKPLELWWRILGILKSAQVTVNVSNPNGKLIFHIEGQRMIPKYLNVKIFELRDKTQEEMYQKIHNYENEIIYPPEDGSSSAISIEGEIPNDQIATFGMNDGSWLNYKQKIYAVLISNDRKIFTGKDGQTIEDNENAVVQLEAIIEEEQKEGKELPIGIIVGIAVGALAIVAVIIIIIIVAVFISKKKKTKKQMSSYGPEMRARDLPMENKFPQNSHSLDAINKAMEDNNW
ncbi:MAG: hypothetical protein EZS28_016851 [Streblomastix strix]|uniref:Right handed beta helix domain-containing protein n=1 Tax=Streblomastix strix TaxID=222440 RepID=A0A5J4VY88_9EUKA|nr:MAG: hypothetical protein EZS28_016851 [Streblomastix strix]